MVFLDHIPYDIVSWLTLRNYSFSDAAEFFIFISGYAAGFVYGPAIAHGQFLAATDVLPRRVLVIRRTLVPCSDRWRYRRPDYGQRRRHDGNGRRGMAVEHIQSYSGSLFNRTCRGNVMQPNPPEPIAAK